MARKAKPPTARSVEALRHRREEATRKNIPTTAYQSVLEKEAQEPVRVAYERRNRDLDPQLVVQADHFGARTAVLLIHSFGGPADDKSREDYQCFAEAMACAPPSMYSPQSVVQ